MINPKAILGEWVTALRSCPDLVTAIGGDGNNIRPFMEGLADHNNLRLAILQMPPGSILIAWQGTRPGRLGSALVFVHEFSLYLRAPESASVGYEDIFNWLVNDVPSSGSLSMLHTSVDANCEPMDFYLPSAQRNTVVISADGATFEYFEIRANLIESQNP